MNAASVAEQLVEWIKRKTQDAGARGVVLGISGGIDSAVVAGLAVRAFPETTLGIAMPCQNIPADLEHAQLVADAFGFEFRTVDLYPVYENFKELLTGGREANPLALANMKPRLRMMTLYFNAQQNNYMVLGTGNRSELTVGYFTKYGDGGVDLLPIGNLVKEQVVELAQYLGVPEPIIVKPPSAGLWEGQTDEEEMGLRYADLDRYILCGQAPEEVKDRIERMKEISEHKRQSPPVADVQI